LASGGLSTVLAVEISNGRTTAAAPKKSSSHHHMAEENPRWGEGAHCCQLSRKLGTFVDSRTISKYMKHGGRLYQEEFRNVTLTLGSHLHALQMDTCA
jgi:hypothetical protein